jgi:hypothetical protein
MWDTIPNLAIRRCDLHHLEDTITPSHVYHSLESVLVCQRVEEGVQQSSHTMVIELIGPSLVGVCLLFPLQDLLRLCLTLLKSPLTWVSRKSQLLLAGSRLGGKCGKQDNALVGTRCDLATVRFRKEERGEISGIGRLITGMGHQLHLVCRQEEGYEGRTRW